MNSYAQYAPSDGVAALNWDVPLRAVASLIQTGPFGSQLKSQEYEVGGVPVINPSHMNGGKISPDPNVAVSPEKAAVLARHALMEGDLVVARRGELGRCAVVTKREVGYLCGTGSALIRPQQERIDARFLQLVFSSRRNKDALSLASVGSTMDNINAGILASLQIPVPDLAIQRRILSFLDDKTAKIDTLIGDQQRLIELLRERRQAMIDHALARSSKERIQLRRFIRFLTSGSRGWGEYYADLGDVFVRIGNLPRGSLSLGGEVKRVNLPAAAYEGQRTKLRIGDLLFSITAYIGSVAVVDQNWVDSYVSQHVALCRIDQSALDPKFTGYFMLTTEGQGQLSEGAFGGAKVQLALDDIRALRVPVPPLDEQRQIVEDLDRETSRIDTLIAESKRFIELARERRSALIAVAVNGQIDVRHEAV